MKIFDIIDNILFLKDMDLYKRHINSFDFQDTFNSFIILRFCSFTSSLQVTILSSNLQFIWKFPKELAYLYLLKTIPKIDRERIKYISNRKQGENQ